MRLELIVLILFVGCAFASFLACWGVRKLLIKFNKLDIPNERSNHTVPVPRGGGIGVMLVIIAAVLAAYFQHGEMVSDFKNIFIGALILAVVSWIDDVRGVPVFIRLAVQLAIVSFLTFNEFSDVQIFQGLLPDIVDKILVILIWVWFLNLFNFMDGIDGIAGVEAISIFAGIFAVTFYYKSPVPIVFFAAVVGGAMLGFLFHNWHPAKLFLGDVGSIPVGFLLGWLLLELAASGFGAVALIIPGYYLADSGVTLLRRLLKKKYVWQAHSEHFYQQAVRNGQSHSDVVVIIALVNIVLLAFSILLSSYVAVLAALMLLVFVLRFFWNSGDA